MKQQCRVVTNNKVMEALIRDDCIHYSYIGFSGITLRLHKQGLSLLSKDYRIFRKYTEQSLNCCQTCRQYKGLYPESGEIKNETSMQTQTQPSSDEDIDDK